MIHNYNLLSEPALGDFISDYDDRIHLGDHLSLQELSFLGIDLQARRILFDPYLRQLDVTPRRELASDYLSLKRIQILDALAPWIEQFDPHNEHGFRNLIQYRNLALVVNQVYKRALKLRENDDESSYQSIMNSLQSVLPKTAFAELQRRNDPHLQQVENLFHLRLLDLNDIANRCLDHLIDYNRKEIIRFVAERMTVQPPRTIAALAKTYPVILDALLKLRESLYDLHVQSLIGRSQPLAERIHDQLYLQHLTSLFLELRPRYERELREIPVGNLPFNEAILDSNMTVEDYVWARDALNRCLEVISDIPQEFGPVKQFPVTSSALGSQIILRQLYTIWSNSSQSNYLKSDCMVNKPTHQVWCYSAKPDVPVIGGKAICYIKWEHDQDSAIATMEALMWQIAGIMDMQSFFTRTRKIYHTRKQWGSFQEVAGGDLYSQYKLNPVPAIPREKFIDAVCICLALGMFDVHGQNIKVEPDGNLKFFDNTRSLSHGNGYLIINMGSDDKPVIVPSFRCCLLDLPEALAKLTDDERLRIAKTIETYERKMDLLQNYLELAWIQRSLKRLHSGWFNTEWVLDAMRKRLANMKDALERIPNLSLVDIATQTIPGYSFSVSLLYLHSLGKDNEEEGERIRKNLHTYVGKDILTISYVLRKKGYEIGYIYDLCKSSDYTLGELYVLLKAYHNSIKMNEKPLFAFGPEYVPTSYDLVVKQLISSAQPDFKDSLRLTSGRSSYRYNVMKIKELIKNETVLHVDDIRDVSWYNREFENPFLLKFLDKQYLVYDTPTGRRMRYIDDFSPPGYQTCKTKQKSLKDICEEIKSAIGDENFDDIPPYPKNVKSLKLTDDNPYAFFQDTNSHLCLITKRKNGTLLLKRYERDLSSDQHRFRFRGKSCTMRQIIVGRSLLK